MYILRPCFFSILERGFGRGEYFNFFILTRIFFKIYYKQRSWEEKGVLINLDDKAEKT